MIDRNQRKLDNAWRTGCCWHTILTAFIKLHRIIIKCINCLSRSKKKKKKNWAKLQIRTFRQSVFTNE